MLGVTFVLASDKLAVQLSFESAKAHGDNRANDWTPKRNARTVKSNQDYRPAQNVKRASRQTTSAVSRAK